MSRSRILSKLIIPIALLTIYSITLYKTATAPVEPTSIEELGAQTTTELQSQAVVEDNPDDNLRPPQAPPPFTVVASTPENMRFVVLTDPKMVPASQAGWLKPDDAILGIVNDGEAQAFPIRQMAFHHVVNTRVAGESFVITYCALCGGYAQGFKSSLGDMRYTFNIFGIYENKLALIDRQTASVWHQLDGEVISGPLTGQGISIQPVILTHGSWDDWKRLHPGTLVLPQFPDYIDQYARISSSDNTLKPDLFTPNESDTRLQSDTIVLGIKYGNFYRAYAINDFDSSTGVFNDDLAGTPLVLFLDDTYRISRVFQATIDDQAFHFSIEDNKIVDQSGTIWNDSGQAIDGSFTGVQLMPLAAIITEWSSWSLYHPETDIYLK